MIMGERGPKRTHHPTIHAPSAPHLWASELDAGRCPRMFCWTWEIRRIQQGSLLSHYINQPKQYTIEVKPIKIPNLLKKSPQMGKP